MPSYEILLDLKGKSFSDGFRALAGQVTRQEVYKVKADGTLADHPYQVTQNTYHIRQLQPTTDKTDPCFSFYQSESLNHNYEQQPDYPRITHQFTLSVNPFGNVTQECNIAYPPRSGMPGTVPAQQRHYVQTLNHSFINITERDRYELGVPLENKEYELAKLHPGANGLFDFIALKTELDAALAAPIEFHEVFLPAAANAQARLIKWDRSYYWNDNRTNILPRGNVGQTTLLHHKENACFSKTLIGDVFGSWVDNNTVQADGHYELKNNYWWQKDNIQHYNTAREFNLLNREERPDGGLIHYTYDAPYFLTLTQVRDALGNRTQAVIDYHGDIVNSCV